MRRSILPGKRLTVWTVLALAVLTTPIEAQHYDGTWVGQAAQWTLTVSVRGTKARLTMSCGGTSLGGTGLIADFDLGPDGSVNTYVTTGAGRRNITGKLPELHVPPPGGLCGSGTATMVKK